MQLYRPFGDWSTYARVQRWQVLQTADPTTRIDPPPYERLPQVGTRYAAPWVGGLEVAFEGEFNRFANPDDHYLGSRLTGDRFHGLGSISRPFYSPGWTLVPKASFNAASYSVDQPLPDGRRSASRVIPTLSIDSAWALERDTSFFGKSFRETLEPRLFYVNTPFKRQDDLPNFDAFGKDFNFDSIFTENTFSGIDRVSDAHQITAGLTSRLVDPQTGVEALRLGIMQRYLFSDQSVTPDGQPLTQNFSDILVLGSTSLVPNWTFDAQAQYNPDSQRIIRSVVGFRYSPGPYRTAEHHLPAVARPVGAGRGRLAVADLRPAAARGRRRRPTAAAAAARSTASAGSTTAPATAASPIRCSAWSTTPAAGSAGSSSSGCPRAAAKRPPACWCNWNSSAFPGSDPIRSGS